MNSGLDRYFRAVQLDKQLARSAAAIYARMFDSARDPEHPDYDPQTTTGLANKG